MPALASKPVPPHLFVLDNHDSFTWNLVQALEAMGASVTVARAGAAPLAALARLRPDGVVVSPGPGAPEQAGDALAVVRAAAAAALPLLGVCLGHQALAVAFGGRVVRAAIPRHGKTVTVHHDGRGLFAGLPAPCEAMLYHSLAVDEASVPAALEVSARGPAGEVMGLRHRLLPLDGVQFHPESIGTPAGATLLARFLARCSRTPDQEAVRSGNELQSASGKRSGPPGGSAARSEAQPSEVHQDASAPTGYLNRRLRSGAAALGRAARSEPQASEVHQAGAAA